MIPMLASATSAVPSGPDWVHEVKWDGMRVLVEVTDGQLRIWSRTERDVTVAFPELAPLAQEYEDLLLDGEIVLLRDGLPSFGALAERFHVTQARRAATLAAAAPVTLMAFDVLRFDGHDVTGLPWSQRRSLLEQLELDAPRWQTPPTFTDGAALLEVTLAQGLEGVVSKRLSSTYRPGVRTGDWLKLPHRATVSVVIGGWRPEASAGRAPSSRRLGAVLVGVPTPDAAGGVRYMGRVGSGLAGKAGAALLARLDALARHRSPFVDEVPREDSDLASWVEPVLVADVESLGLAASGRLRQPAFKRLRPDLDAADVEDPWTREMP